MFDDDLFVLSAGACLLSSPRHHYHRPPPTTTQTKKTGIVTTPLDVLKTRLMTQGASGRYANVFDAAAQIARTEGVSAFMAGWQPRLIWISIGGFVFFPVLEAAKKLYAPQDAVTTPFGTEFVVEELEGRDLERARKRAAKAAAAAAKAAAAAADKKRGA